MDVLFKDYLYSQAGNIESLCRLPEFRATPMVCDDGIYNLIDEKYGKFTQKVTNGFIDGQPALVFEDGHVEYWKEGHPYRDDDTLPAIISKHGTWEEYWHNKRFITRKVIQAFDREITMDDIPDDYSIKKLPDGRKLTMAVHLLKPGSQYLKPGYEYVTKSRMKSYFGKFMNKPDGIYLFDEGTQDEHVVRIKNGFINGYEDHKAAVEYHDGHCEYWVMGYPGRLDKKASIIGPEHYYTEYWSGGKVAAFTEFIEMTIL